jgi:sulfotransferase
LLVEHDLVVSRPADVFKLIYEFLGETPFAHDFNNVPFDAPELDAQLGLDGLHRVHPKVEPLARQPILPPDLFERCNKLPFWRDMPTSKVFRIVAQAEHTQSQAMPQRTPKLDRPA